MLQLASPVQKVILDGLSAQLGLSGENRIAEAARLSSNRPRRRSRTQRSGREVERLSQRIAADVKSRWPELSNVLNPLATELLTNRSAEFVRVVEGHEDYPRYRELSDGADNASSEQKRQAKYHRFLRTADNVVFAENLRRSSNRLYRDYLAIVEAESQTLVTAAK